MTPSSNSLSRRRCFTIFAAADILIPVGSLPGITDYHQHLYSPEAGARSSPGPKGITARDLIAHLDVAGIRRAVVLSVAYSFSNPNKPSVVNEYEHVMAENDWTSAQVANFPKRLLGFCSVNPLRAYARGEIKRCARDANLRTGLKLHFGNSDVNLEDSEHLAQVRRVFRTANQNRMAIAIHLRSNIDHKRPYGAKEARIFLEQVLPEAPDVTIQVAHLAGGGGYDDPAIDDALAVLAEAIQRNDRRVKNVYFDVSGVAIAGMWEDKADLLVRRMRQIGMKRLLYGSDAPIAGNLPEEALERWHRLPLTRGEFRTVETNVAPHLRSWPQPAR